MNQISKLPVALVIALALFLVLSTPAFALEMQGVVRSVQPDTPMFSLTAPDGTDHNFRLAVGGLVFVNNQASRLQEILPGDRIVVTFEVESNEMVASVVNCTRD